MVGLKFNFIVGHFKQNFETSSFYWLNIIFLFPSTTNKIYFKSKGICHSPMLLTSWWIASFSRRNRARLVEESIARFSIDRMFLCFLLGSATFANLKFDLSLATSSYSRHLGIVICKQTTKYRQKHRCTPKRSINELNMINFMMKHPEYSRENFSANQITMCHLETASNFVFVSGRLHECSWEIAAILIRKSRNKKI